MFSRPGDLFPTAQKGKVIVLVTTVGITNIQKEFLVGWRRDVLFLQIPHLFSWDQFPGFVYGRRVMKISRFLEMKERYDDHIICTDGVRSRW